ncbi:hypothetical protein [Enterobacter hormaechei]|nr:hypothetical protein [Enterobacter hormaechei]MDK9637836.1 hypothetical protein [Enterobacter hormaechei]
MNCIYSAEASEVPDVEQTAAEELNYREFPCSVQQEWSSRHQRGMDFQLK